LVRVRGGYTSRDVPGAKLDEGEVTVPEAKLEGREAPEVDPEYGEFFAPKVMIGD
jgi:hypothetical protein